MRRAAAFAAWLALAAGSVGAQEAQPPQFERDVLPILQRRCLRCHEAPKTDTAGRTQAPKGGLRLDGRGHFLRGGDGGAVLEPGSLADSEIYQRVILSPDDPDYMPSKGEGMNAREVAILERWIASGAEFGAWQGASDVLPEVVAPPPSPTSLPVPPRVQAYRELAEGLGQPPQAQLERLQKLGARVTPILGTGDARLLRVGFPSGATQIERSAIAALAAVRAHLAELDLARTTFDEADLFAELARMTRLVRVDLRETAVRGTALGRLRTLEHLDTLNLFGCLELTDDAIPELARLEQLERLHVWQSGLSEKGIARLQKELPNTRVFVAPELPAPRPAEERARRR
ncbi:MAG: c-type cytochrome domain-containing protein [Planctomycetota bacterium]